MGWKSRRNFVRRAKVFSGKRKSKKNPRSSCFSSEIIENNDNKSLGASARKINNEEMDSYESAKMFDIVDINELGAMLKKVVMCKKCSNEVELLTTNRSGISVTIKISCSNCDIIGEMRNSEEKEYIVEGKKIKNFNT